MLFDLQEYVQNESRNEIDWCCLTKVMLVKEKNDVIMTSWNLKNPIVILWENIEDCYLDTASIVSYGGWGIRVGKVDDKWRLACNIIGIPRVMLSLNKGRFGEFVFSTKNPEEYSYPILYTLLCVIFDLCNVFSFVKLR